MTRATSRGFTLIELLVALVIAGILLMLALPNYHRWIADAQVANAASTLADGLRFAQGEAIKRNTNIEFTLTTGIGWSIQQPAGSAIKVSTFPEGSKYAVLTPVPAGVGTITFSSFGLIVPNAVAPLAGFTAVDVTAPSGTRPLRVLVGGGSTGIKVCDPKFLYSNAHPDGCP